MRVFRKTESGMQLTKDPESVTNLQSSFHDTISFVVVFGQIIGIMPLYGIMQNIQNVEFRWISMRVFYSYYNIIGAFAMGVFCIVRFGIYGLMLDQTATASFYILNFCGAVQFIQIAKHWATILKETASVEIAFKKYSMIFNMRRRFIIITFIVMVLAVIEHLLFILNALSLTENCPNFENNKLKMYFTTAFPHVFQIIEYDHWKAFFVESFNVLSTFTWNFTDLFIILICCALAGRFAQINHKLENNKAIDEKFWKDTREDYNKLAHLVYFIDEYLSPLVLISFISNVFFLCVQLYNSMKQRVGVMETIYYFYSFGFVLGRTAAVTLYAAWINDESRKPLLFLHSVPSEHYCVEINRFIQRINAAPVIAMSGHRYFYVTRNFLFKMASTIVTFELMFLQFGNHPEAFKTSSGINICAF